MGSLLLGRMMLGKIVSPKLEVKSGTGIAGGVTTLGDGAGTLGDGTTTGGGGEASLGNTFGGEMTIGGENGLRR